MKISSEYTSGMQISNHVWFAFALSVISQMHVLNDSFLIGQGFDYIVSSRID